MTVDAAARKVLRIAIRHDTDELGNPTDDKRPLEYYTHYTFFENPNGFYGLGLGQLVGPLNKSCNALLRQVIDAATLATVGNMSGFISSALPGLQGGETEIEMGKLKKVNATGDEIQKAIFLLKFPGPNPALFNALQLMLSRADRFAQTTEAVTGQMEKVQQPTTVLALLDESAKQFSAVNERVVSAWNEELMKLYALNGRHMDPVEYFSVLDISGSLEGQQISREDYAPDYQIVAAVDPQMKTDKERLQKAQMAYQFLATNPLVMQSPIHFHNASKWYLEQLRVDGLVTESVLPNPLMLDQAALMAAMMNLGKDGAGLPNGATGQGGGAGLAAGPDNGMGLQPLDGAEGSDAGMDDSNMLGGDTAATGPARSPGLPDLPAGSA